VKAVALLFLTLWAVAACGLPRTNTYISMASSGRTTVTAAEAEP
jgi:hypothetical protein